MIFKNKFFGLFLYNQIICRYFEMPFYAVIFKTSKAGSVAGNWEVARGLRDGTPNSYAKKFDSKIEAEKYIKEFNFKIVDNAKNTIEPSGLGVKRKRSENPTNSNSLLKEHIAKIKTSFDDFQMALSLFPNYADQVKNLNEDVMRKLHSIFKETMPKEEFSLVNSPTITLGDLIHKSVTTTSQNNKSFTSLFDSDFHSPEELEKSKKSFTFNDKNEVVVYTDGACSNNGFNGASAGAGVWFGYGHPLNLSVKVPGTQTNNNAEIFSTIKAIELVKASGHTRICIKTDSGFVIKSINEWMPRWQANGWKTQAGSDVKNKDMFVILDQRIKSMDSVSWIHVPGHKGITGNEEADKLARLGATM